ncbi:Alpha/Beta hydrolase protein [Gorgonomyces haynaldii]|nr:Alpha/Beta hydrolase protein [Gorgonomyces haynaldii]
MFEFDDFEGLSVWKILLYLFGIYVVFIILHQILLGWYYLGRGKTGTRLLLKEHKLAFHYILEEKQVDSYQLPLVVFESHLGLGMGCWHQMQHKLLEKLPTLAYQRSGYGWSTELDYSGPRTAEEMATELRLLLEALKFDKHPIILVGHSFGGIVCQTYKLKYDSKHLIGMVLLDAPPSDHFIKHPEIKSFTSERIPKSLSTAGSLADLGWFRLAGLLFGVSSVQVTQKMKQLMDKKALDGIWQLSFDSRTIRTIGVEMQGYSKSLDNLNEALKEHDNKFTPCFVITPEKVDPPVVDVKMTQQQWQDEWHKGQIQTAVQYNKRFGFLSESQIIVEKGLSHSDLFLSDSILDAIDQCILLSKKK